MNNTDILFAILNYKETVNTERLYNIISPHFPCRVFDADSGERPDAFNGDTVYLPNIYFGGLLNEAIRLAIEGRYTYLFFICSDVMIDESQFLKMKHILLNEDFGDVAIYCPAHALESYTFVRWAYVQPTNKKRKVPCVEAMLSMWHKDIFERITPCNENKYGWGIDIVAAFFSKQKKKNIYIDDRVQIFHPMGAVGKNDAAGQCALQYIDKYSDAKKIRLLWHWIYVYRNNYSANILLTKYFWYWCKIVLKLSKRLPFIKCYEF